MYVTLKLNASPKKPHKVLELSRKHQEECEGTGQVSEAEQNLSKFEKHNGFPLNCARRDQEQS